MPSFTVGGIVMTPEINFDDDAIDLILSQGDRSVRLTVEDMQLLLPYFNQYIEHRRQKTVTPHIRKVIDEAMDTSNPNKKKNKKDKNREKQNKPTGVGSS